ncbi:hypothetical protein QBC39DRAFT_400403, partial [Podospora conica]
SANNSSPSPSPSPRSFNPEDHGCLRPPQRTGHHIVRTPTLEVAPKTAPALLPRQPKMENKVANWSSCRLSRQPIPGHQYLSVQRRLPPWRLTAHRTRGPEKQKQPTEMLSQRFPCRKSFSPASVASQSEYLHSTRHRRLSIWICSSLELPFSHVCKQKLTGTTCGVRVNAKACRDGVRSAIAAPDAPTMTEDAGNPINPGGALLAVHTPPVTGRPRLNAISPQ